MQNRREDFVAQQVAAGTCLAISLCGILLGSVCTLGGSFVGWQFVLAGTGMVAYSLAGIFLAEKLISFMTVFAIRCGLLWSGVGLAVIATATLEVLVESQDTNDMTGVISLSFILLVQTCNIVAFAILARQQARMARS